MNLYLYLEEARKERNLSHYCPMEDSNIPKQHRDFAKNQIQLKQGSTST